MPRLAPVTIATLSFNLHICAAPVSEWLLPGPAIVNEEWRSRQPKAGSRSQVLALASVVIRPRLKKLRKNTWKTRIYPRVRAKAKGLRFSARGGISLARSSAYR
jgi:hypothetical protein